MVHITQPEAFELLATMEGPQWRVTEEKKRDKPYGFFFWLDAWRNKAAAGLDDEPISLCQFAGQATRAPMLYGAEGHRRYLVNPDGEVVLLRESTLPDAAEKAQRLGFHFA